jgi:hypothetical protein
LVSIRQGSHQTIGHDFHVFWQAGRDFATGHPLYRDYLPGARQFKYPPFAAFLFQALAIFPLKVAAVFFSVLNLCLWGVSLFLTREIVARISPPIKRANWLLLLAGLLSAQFFLDNFHHVQMNEVILVLTLLGISAYLNGLELRAAAFLVAATAIKVTPIFFLTWLILRGSRRTLLAVPLLLGGCILLPLALRGRDQGVEDLREYYHTFLEGHQHGNIDSYTAGQNLAAMISRMSRAGASESQSSYRYLPLSQQQAQLTYRVLWMAVLLLFLARLAELRIRHRPVTGFEPSMVFLAGYLLSPITFTTHLVGLLFVFYVFLSIPREALRPQWFLPAGIILSGILITGLSGRDLVGRTAYLAVRGYSLMAWTLLLLFLASVVLAGRRSRTVLSPLNIVSTG